MMNPAIVMTTNEYNVAYLVNELVTNGISVPASDIVQDMVLMMSEQSLEEASIIYSYIGLPSNQPEYNQHTAEILMDTFFDMIEGSEPSQADHRASFAVNFLNASPITAEQWRGELKELVLADSFANFKEEIADVLYMSYCILYQRTGIDLKMRGARPSTRKFIKRTVKWKEIFSMWQMDFSKDYLVGGSNYLKPAKVASAYELALADQSR